MKKILTLLCIAIATLSAVAQPVKLSNIVCFVKFADQADNSWEQDFSYYENMFNATGPEVNSVRNYFSEMSYGRMDWESHLILTEYVDSHPRSYFCAKSESNPDGYTSLDLLLDTRTRTLVKDMCEYLSTVIPDDVELDANHDGKVDNIVMIINGNSELGASHMLWPANNTAPAARLKGMQVGNYLKVFDGANGYKSLVAQKLNTGVLCHEMMHTLNAYDLYSSSSSPVKDPVGVWDLMSDNNKVPQGLTAYIRMTYGKNYGGWLKEDEIPVLSEEGEYEILPLSAQTDPDNGDFSSASPKAYMVKPDADRKEYFMIEYRDDSNIWDRSLPYSGLLVYRVNPQIQGNTGKNCEVYIFRPGGSLEKTGVLSKAPLGQATGRLTFGLATDNDYPFYSDGERAQFCITDVKETANGLSFRFHPNTTGDAVVGDIPAETPLSGRIFTLQGIELDHIPCPGLYIINGKKVLIP